MKYRTMKNGMLLLVVGFAFSGGVAHAFGGSHEVVQDVIDFGQDASSFYHSITNYDFGNTHVHLTTSSVTITYHFRVGPIRLIQKDPKTNKVISIKDLPPLDVSFDSLEAPLLDKRVPLKVKDALNAIYIPRKNAFLTKFTVAASEVREIQKAKNLSESASLELLKSKLKLPIADLISGVPLVVVD